MKNIVFSDIAGRGDPDDRIVDASGPYFWYLVMTNHTFMMPLIFISNV
jgi:hypothetical protein